MSPKKKIKWSDGLMSSRGFRVHKAVVREAFQKT